ncbi:MAG: cupin domain-containing protein [Duncaniella sp.]|nr:cupin domain-containing protein [Duncaniella sp.]
MKQIQQLSGAENYGAINLGNLTEIKDYVLELSPEIKIPGKVFGGQAVGATGGEFSFQVFAPGQETGFLHTHKSHEELYFFLSGKGEFQVDGEVFPVGEGSVVRVAPAGRRSVRNNGAQPLVMLCVQYRGDTFTADDITDGDIIAEPVKW